MKRPFKSKYRRNAATDPHVPHTTEFKRRDDTQIPPEAEALINERWPEMVRMFQQYDQNTGMLELYRIVRDACKAANWPDSMAYLMRDHILAKLNDSKMRYFHQGDHKTFRMGESVAEGVVAALLEILGRDRVPPHQNLEPDAEVDMAAKSGFTAWEYAMRSGRSHPKLAQAVKGTPYEKLYNGEFSQGRVGAYR